MLILIGDKKSNVHAYLLLLLIGDKKSNLHAYFDDDDTMTATITSGGEEIVVEVIINKVPVLAKYNPLLFRYYMHF